MIYSHDNHNHKHKTFSKKQLILFLINESSKLVDRIISALKSKNFTLYKLYSPNHQQQSPSNTYYLSDNEKHAYEIISLLK